MNINDLLNTTGVSSQKSDDPAQPQNSTTPVTNDQEIPKAESITTPETTATLPPLETSETKDLENSPSEPTPSLTLLNENTEKNVDSQITTENINNETAQENPQPTPDPNLLVQSDQTTTQPVQPETTDSNTAKPTQTLEQQEVTEPEQLDIPAQETGDTNLNEATTTESPQLEQPTETAQQLDEVSELSLENVQSEIDKIPQESNEEVKPEVTEQQIDSTPQPSVEQLNVSNQKYPYTIGQLLEIVVQKNASDLHIGVGYPAIIRIDGELQPISNDIIDTQTAKELIFSILSEENKEIVEINKEVDVAYAYEDIARFRVNVFHSTGTIGAALRLIPNQIRTMQELNLPKIYNDFVKLKQGLVLVTGPTGHGKSTTLASILNEINNTRPVHIITIEDPIEYVYPKSKALVNQREMKQDTHSWDIALKSILREDPDVVLVGEMRDYETISAAITIAETGHLVFATLHTNSAAQTIDRIIDVFPEHQQGQIRTQLAVVIEGVIAQRLVKLKGGGRRAVSEVMLGTSAVRNIIREGKTYQLDNVIRTSGDIGMISIEKSLVELVREGLISVEDAQVNAVSPEEVIRLLK